MSPIKLLRSMSSGETVSAEDFQDATARAKWYPTLPFTYLRLGYSRSGLWTEVDETVLVGAAPSTLRGHPKKLAAMGVRGVVNCCSEYSGPVAAYRKLGIEQLRIPTVDHVEPSSEDLATAVAFIQRHRRAGGRVLVHCKAGHGRSAAVGYAWLLFKARGQKTPRTVFRQLSSKRDVRKSLWSQPNVGEYREALELDEYRTRPASLLPDRAAPRSPSPPPRPSSRDLGRGKVTPTRAPRLKRPGSKEVSFEDEAGFSELDECADRFEKLPPWSV
mmetsp:Transcript_11017/g.32873  ORF Transcript_11017/g.32873 Transcript_11017/m.32873 type:complete len:274 (+) Transcript_11017:552-1373(+)